MQERSPSLSGALEAARDGIEQARERGRKVAERRARGDRQVDDGRKRAEDARSEQDRRADMLEDTVELSRAAKDVRANAQVFREASGVSREVVNLGRRLDVRA